MSSAESHNSMSVVDDSTFVTDESGNQNATNNQSSASSSTSSTVVPPRQILGRAAAGVADRGIVYDPTVYPENARAPQPVIDALSKFCELNLAHAKSAVRNFITRRNTFLATRAHLQEGTFPHDLRHTFTAHVQYPHSVPKEVRDNAQVEDNALFLEFKIALLNKRLPIYEMDMKNAQETLSDLKNRDKMQAKFFAETSSNFGQFMPAVNFHLIGYLGCVDKMEKTAIAADITASQKLTAAKEASMAKHAAKSAAAATGTPHEKWAATEEARQADTSVTNAEQVMTSMPWLENELSRMFQDFRTKVFRRVNETLPRETTVRGPGISLNYDNPRSRFSPNHQPPAAAAAAQKPTFNQPAASAAAAARTNAANNAPNSGKGPKNSSGSGRGPTHERGQDQQRRSRQDQPWDDRNYHYDRPQDYRQYDSRPSSRSASSHNKRPPAPSLDQEEGRSRSRPRPTPWQQPRYRSPPRDDRGAAFDHGNGPPQNYYYRDSRDRDFEHYDR